MRDLVSVALTVVAILMIGALGHVYLLDESMELDVSQSLCKAVCNHLVGRDVREFDSL